MIKKVFPLIIVCAIVLTGCGEKKLKCSTTEEVNGIDKALYGLIDLFVEIPMKGKKESFNVSVAAGIALALLSFSW